MKHRSEIDGLRCVAILPVVLFHAGVPGFSGGFVGVDIFFVISGFLITKILMDDLAGTGSISFVEFYHRRARRILPGLLVVLAATTIAAGTLLMPKDYEAYGGSMFAAVLFFSNFYFAAETGYFDGPAELKPLLHTWSLSVEEQFYIFFPVLLWGLWKWQRRNLAAWLFSLMLLSLAACIWTTTREPGHGFFWSPFRAWELLIGALLGMKRAPVISLPWRSSAEVFGLGLIAFSIVTYSVDTAFPGFAAIAPCLGAALIIDSGGAGAVSRLLSVKPVVFVGLISYSLYLWHWPLLSLSRYANPGDLSWPAVGLVVASSFALAALTWLLVEQPFRTRTVMPIRAHMLWAASASLLFAATTGAVIWFSGGWPGRLDPEAQRYAAMYDSTLYRSIYERGECFLDSDQTAPDYNADKCLRTVEQKGGGTLLFGDSYAAHLYPGLKNAIDNVHQYTAASCRPFATSNRRCAPFYQTFFDKILPVSGADTVVVAGNWARTEQRIGRSAIIQGLTATLDLLRQAGVRTVLVGQPPDFERPVPYILAMSAKTDGRFLIKSHDMGELNGALKALAASHGAIFFDPFAHACGSDGCLAALDGRPLHWDGGHLTSEGSGYYAAALSQLLSQR